MKKRYIKEIYNTKTEWLKHRGIGGSDVATILGKSKWQSIDELYSRLALGKMRADKTNDRMQEGVLAEPLIRKLFAIEHKEYKVYFPPVRKHWLFRSIEHPLMTCTPDGLFRLPNGDLFGLEIKDVELIKTEDRNMWEDNQLPNQYYIQLIQYLIVLNDLKGVCLLARLKYFKFDEEGRPQYDYSIDRKYWVFREDVAKDTSYVESKEIGFIENNIKKRVRPTLKIKF